MGNRFFLCRWFRDISIARKLYFTVSAMALLIGIELFVVLFSLNTLSSLRAYVGGEGLWSKAQKDAVFHLYRYGVSHIDKDYELFVQFMQIPLGDAKARRELLMDNWNMNVARQGFLEGRNHPDDIAGMIKLFTRFGGVYYIEKAVSIWGDAQAIAMQLLPIAEKLHDEVKSPHPSQARIEESLASIYATNEKVTALEDDFSFTLGEGSRWWERIVLKLLLTTAITVETTGLLLILSISRNIHKGIANIVQAANLFAAGCLSTRAKVLSCDEIGVLATSFNDMADNLETRVKELGQLNQHLTNEIVEREHAQTILREVNETLETRVVERTATLTHLVDTLHKEAGDREQAEAALRQSQKMDAIGQLTGGIAHDFNNMLTGISGNIEMMSRRIAQGRTTGLTAYIEAAQTSTARAATLTHRLLAFARRQTLDPKPIDLNLLVRGMEELLKTTAGPAVLVRTKLSAGLWSILCDRNQLENVLLNLIFNACDAMPHGGSLLIETANAAPDRGSVSADGSRDLPLDDYVALIITDNGVGMSPAILARAFEPFFTTKPFGQGTGLGLSMIYGFVQQSGGQVFLRSKEGSGTTVTIHLPRHLASVNDVAEVAISAESGSQEAPANAVVLVVEDEPDVRMVIVDLLEDIGYTVLAADDGASGLRIVDSQTRIDLLVSDVGLPGGLNGRQLAAVLRLSHPLSYFLMISI
jgi:signal transduction histidine kinase